MIDLISKLQTLIGASVARLGLLVWPDACAPETTDVRLYLDLRTLNGEDRHVVIGTCPDGQTPSIEFEYVVDAHSIEEFAERRELWKHDDFWTSKDSYRWELFIVNPNSQSDLAVMQNEIIVRAFLVLFEDGNNGATGVVLEFGSSKRIWSIPSAYGNAVKTYIPDDWWPAPVRLMDLAARDLSEA